MNGNSTLQGDDSNVSMLGANSAILDEVDIAILKCQEEQGSFKNLCIEKLHRGLYKVEKKEYVFKILAGNNLAIKMYAGYIFTDCLVHFDDEMTMIVKN